MRPRLARAAASFAAWPAPNSPADPEIGALHTAGLTMQGTLEHGGGSGVALLLMVHQLMSQQAAPVVAGWGVLSRSKDDVVAHGVGPSSHGFRRSRGNGV
jgi:hypothetical protein